MADVIAMWYMAINAFVTDVIVTCGLDPLEVSIVTDRSHIVMVVDVITTVADGITTIG